jgi:zinc protease
VVGDTDEDTVRGLVTRHFGPLARGPEIHRRPVVEPPQTARRQATLNVPVRLPVIVGAYHIAAGDSQDLYPLEVLQQILAGGDSSRLYQRIVRKDKLAVYAGGGVYAHEDPGLFYVFAAFLPGGDPAHIRAALDEEITRVGKEPVGAEELAKAKNQLAAQAVYEQERVSGLASRMGRDGIVEHDPLASFTAPAKYDAVTAADVERVAQKYLVETNLSQVTLQAGGGK